MNEKTKNFFSYMVQSEIKIYERVEVGHVWFHNLKSEIYILHPTATFEPIEMFNCSLWNGLTINAIALRNLSHKFVCAPSAKHDLCCGQSKQINYTKEDKKNSDVFGIHCTMEKERSYTVLC